MSNNVYATESWTKVYSAFEQINFTSFDGVTIKQSLIDYMRKYHAEDFNDFIESSELMMLIETFCYVAELLAYRIDMAAHENFIGHAQRKQSILRLVKLISYVPSRNIAGRGLVKITTIRTSEDVYDSLGINLKDVPITWNDTNNTNWKEQFFIVMQSVLSSAFGQPGKAFQVNDVNMQIYSLNNTLYSLKNGVYPFTVNVGNNVIPMEVVPSDISENSVFEKAPDINSQFTIIYSNDGRGDGSDYTGFLMFVKQGTMIRIDQEFTELIPNSRLKINSSNINNTDIWVYGTDDDGVIKDVWDYTQNLQDKNIFYVQNANKKRFEVETLENDSINFVFGDGDFSEMPIGKMQFWARSSSANAIVIPKNKIANEPFQVAYIAKNGLTYNFACNFSLTSAIQNNAPSESIEQIRQNAPATYYSQNRMVNAQDYNTFMLKDQSILRLKAVNRTFAGQPKHVEWNDASKKYQNVKIFGDDLTLCLDVHGVQRTPAQSEQNLIDSFLEKQLSTPAIVNSILYSYATGNESDGIITVPRTRFIEDNRKKYFDIDGAPVNPYGKNLGQTLSNGLHQYTDIILTNAPGHDGSLNEKTAIQSAINRHWYGEPLSYAVINGLQHGVIPNPSTNPSDDGKLYNPNLRRTIDGVSTYPSGDTGSGLQTIGQYTAFGLRFNRFLKAFGNGTITYSAASVNGYSQIRKETITLECQEDGVTFTVISNLRGKFPAYNIDVGGNYSDQASADVRDLPFDFVLTQGSTRFAQGDAFVIDLVYDAATSAAQQSSVYTITTRTFGTFYLDRVNLNGWWEVVPESVIKGAESAGGTGLFATNQSDFPDIAQQMTFEPDSNPYSWLFVFAKNDSSWSVMTRTMKIIAESKTTNFWVNTEENLIDAETHNPVFDRIKILRSNPDANGDTIKTAQVYDVVGLVSDIDGIIIPTQLEVMPTGITELIRLNTDTTLISASHQFFDFSARSYQYGYVNSDGRSITWLNCGEYDIGGGYDTGAYDTTSYDSTFITFNGISYEFESDGFVGKLVNVNATDAPTIVRRRFAPGASSPTASENNEDGCNITDGLDFMWQHFTSMRNLIDPSPTNIHDVYLMTRGYHTSMLDYINGVSSVAPSIPSTFDLKIAYEYLLANKMWSDTVVLHHGKVKLLFGELAEQEFRGKFKVVKSPSSTLSNEKIKFEILAIINNYFDIKNWDFGQNFYATDLLSLIHQRLGMHISSVVIVPTYAANSFGSLFSIPCSGDEIFQSAATFNDIEIVSNLSSIVLRQTR